MLAHPDLQGLRQTVLATRDAQGLYERFGFEANTSPLMVLAKPAEALYRIPAEKLIE